MEEVARVYGYDNIPDVPVRADLVMTQHREADLTLKRVKTMLVDNGYREAITYSFVDPKVQALLHPNEEALILPEPDFGRDVGDASVAVDRPAVCGGV